MPWVAREGPNDSYGVHGRARVSRGDSRAAACLCQLQTAQSRRARGLPTATPARKRTRR